MDLVSEINDDDDDDDDIRCKTYPRTFCAASFFIAEPRLPWIRLYPYIAGIMKPAGPAPRTLQCMNDVYCIGLVADLSSGLGRRRTDERPGAR